MTKGELEQVCAEYFVSGSSFKGRGWLASQIIFNRSDRSHDEFGLPQIRTDLELLHRKFGVKVFFYGPPLWMFGHPFNSAGTQNWTADDFKLIVSHSETVTIDSSTTLFRTQINIDGDVSPARFCSPPQELRNSYGRFDSKHLPVFYASYDISTCLHESRVTVADEIHVSILNPARSLKLLDLTSCGERYFGNNHDNPAIWLRCLIFGGRENYKTCRRLSKYILDNGFDGFLSPSYFQQVSRRQHTNVSLFGRPIIEKKLLVSNINKVVLEDVDYQYVFGPAVPKEDSEP